jgi:hypothetical protein
MKRLICLSLLLPSLALADNIGEGGLNGIVEGGGSVGGSVTDNLCLGDDEELYLGNTCAAPDYWWIYNNTDSQLELWSTNVNGGGADATILVVDDAQRVVQLLGGLIVGAGSFPLISNVSPTDNEPSFSHASGEGMGGASGTTALYVNSNDRLTCEEGVVTVNADDEDVDFVVNTDSGADAIYVDAGINALTKLAFRQGDLTSTCTIYEVAIDTAGTKEFCMCQATDTWYCIAVTDATGPAD